jgi:hypothetical protein
LGLLLQTGFAHAVEVDEEAQKLLGIQTATLEKTTIAPQAVIYASVISPAPLIDLFRQTEAAKTATQLSKDALQRAEKLFSSGELVARKDVEAARGQLAQDEAKGVALEDRIALEWGSAFSAMSEEERAGQIKALLTGTRALVRLALPKGEWLDEAPLSAQISMPGHERKALHSSQILPATATDPAFQAQTFLGIFDADHPLPPPGTTLSGSLELPGEKEEGLLVPQSAVVFFQSHAWIYHEAHEGQFERIEIPVTRPLPEGWFVGKESIEPEDIVTTGAQPLLSKEALGDAPAGD